MIRRRNNTDKDAWHLPGYDPFHACRKLGRQFGKKGGLNILFSNEPAANALGRDGSWQEIADGFDRTSFKVDMSFLSDEYMN